MADTTVNLPEWRRILDERNASLIDLAVALRMPFWTVYSYSRANGRKPSAEWEKRAEAAARKLGRAPEEVA